MCNTVWARLWLGSWKSDGILVDVDTGQQLTEATFESEGEALAYIKANNLPIVIAQVRYI